MEHMPSSEHRKFDLDDRVTFQTTTEEEFAYLVRDQYKEVARTSGLASTETATEALADCASVLHDAVFAVVGIGTNHELKTLTLQMLIDEESLGLGIRSLLIQHLSRAPGVSLETCLEWLRETRITIEEDEVRKYV